MRSIVPFLVRCFFAVLLILPWSAQAATPYSVSLRTGQPFQPIPINHPEAQAPTTHPPGSTANQWVPLSPMPDGFSFRFFDQDMSSVWISSMGFLRFQADTNWQWVNRALGTGAGQEPRGLIAPWWGDQDIRGGHFKVQMLGNVPGSRTLVIEWKIAFYLQTNFVNFQVWLYEGSSTIEIHYGSHSGGTFASTMGIESLDGTIGYPIPSAATGASCGSSCGTSDWHTNTVVTFSQGPELRLTEVQGVQEAFAGIRMPMSAKVTNVGGKPANDFTVRFYISPTQGLSQQARELVTLDGDLRSLQPQESAVFEANPRLPIDLESGRYFIVAEADPHRVVAETNRGDNFASFGPFDIGIRAANLEIPFVDLDADRVGPGGTVQVSWLTNNVGNLDAVRPDYKLVLTPSGTVSPSSIPLAVGPMEDIAMSGSTYTTSSVTIPTGVEPGVYHIGVIVDPNRIIFEHDRSDNVAVSSPLLVADDGLVIVTNEVLPPAQLLGHYSVRLDALGGDGALFWGMGADSTLPPGLSLITEERGGASATFLRGIPGAIGTFSFDLAVESLTAAALRTFELQIEPPDSHLFVANDSMALASFGFRYEEWLSATGGTPPYTWTITKGHLPEGVLLRSDGLLSGTPQQDGRFELTFRVVDSNGHEGSKVLDLHVAPPSVLTCVTRTIPELGLQESVRFPLLAAGGIKRGGDVPYEWISKDAIRMATQLGEVSGTLSGPPPGLTIEDGYIRGKPTAFGTFVWNLEVRDAKQDKTDCKVTVHVPPDRGLTITTQRLPVARAGSSFRAHLAATGGDGALDWSELGDGRVLSDLGLTFENGFLVGTPSLDALAGESSKEFSFMVRVVDEAGRIGLNSMNLRLEGERLQPAKQAKEDGGGCQAGAGTTGPWALGLLGLWLISRRRRWSDGPSA